MFELPSIPGIAAIPGILAILIALYAGGFTGARILMAIAKSVALVATMELDNLQKREKALELVYAQFPVISKFVPKETLGKFLELVYHDVLKPLLVMPLPPAPPKEAPAPAMPAKEEPKEKG